MKPIETFLFRQPMVPDTTIDLATGLLVTGKGVWTNYLPIPVHAGDKVCLAAPEATYILAYYSQEVSDTYIYTYAYAPESNWATYRKEDSDLAWSSQERTIEKDGFVRLSIRISAPADVQLNDLFSFSLPEGKWTAPSWIQPEAQRVQAKVRELQKEGDDLFLLLADTHYAVGCSWEDTRESLRQVTEMIQPEGMIHLGDFTDGLMPKRMTKGLASAILEELREICPNLYPCIGNHDKNRFRKNPEGLTDQECAELYLGKKDPWYIVTFPKKKLRFLFLDSFSQDEKDRYGFTMEQLAWLSKTLWLTKGNYYTLIFSHVPPEASIHVWSEVIRNGEKAMEIVEKYQHYHPGKVLGWIHGHNHADQVFTKRTFPIIGVGCAKLESFQEHKPEGSVTFEREKNNPSQELFDVLLVRPKEGKLGLIRFGAGTSRIIQTNTVTEDPRNGTPE